MSAILPANLFPIDKAEIRLIYESRGLQSVIRTFARHAPPCQTVQFVVNERCQLFKRGLVPITPRAKQFSQFVG